MWLLDTNTLIACLTKSKNGTSFVPEQTFTTILNVIEYPPVANCDDLVVIHPSLDHYTHSLDYAIKLRIKGTPIPAIDLVIGAIAVDRKLCLVTNDAHFDYFREIETTLRVCSVGDYLKDISQNLKKGNSNLNDVTHA